VGDNPDRIRLEEVRPVDLHAEGGNGDRSPERIHLGRFENVLPELHDSLLQDLHVRSAWKV
jgi:hypothetical protein